MCTSVRDEYIAQTRSATSSGSMASGPAPEAPLTDPSMTISPAYTP
ncbi:hypothetical protein [Corynebacterium variabile]|nr:hypothetical protein [Corynebacterium variabile]